MMLGHDPALAGSWAGGRTAAVSFALSPKSAYGTVASPLALLVIAVTTTAGTAVGRERTEDGKTRPKVVVVVGPVGQRTAEYEATGRRLATHARNLGARVTGIYPRRATWSRVARAARGADVFVYMGHGNGWPSPYPPFQTVTQERDRAQPIRRCARRTPSLLR